MNPVTDELSPNGAKDVEKGVKGSDVPSSRPRKQPSLKAVKYVENRQKGMNKKDAALDAGYAESTSNNVAEKIEGTKSIQDLMDKAGLTEAKLLAKLAEGLEADKPFGKFGDIHPDYAARHRYVVTGLQMRNLLKEQPQFNTQVNIIAKSEEVAKINEDFVSYLHSKFGGKDNE